MSILISSAEETFLHVGALISISILLFGYINYKTSGKFIDLISKNKKYQPLIGSVMGVLPGCGGSIVLMPLFVKQKVSFGTIVASLISSMGDSAFLLIVSDFKSYVIISIISLITGIITGYIVDSFNLEEKLDINNLYRKNNKSKSCGLRSEVTIHISSDEGDNNQTSKNISKLEYEIIHGIGYKIYLALLIIGFLFMVLAHSNLEIPIVEVIHSLEEIIAILGIIASFIYMIISKKFVENENAHDNEHKLMSLKETIIHSVSEISFVIVWIFLAYIIYDIIILMAGGEDVLVNIILGLGTFSVLAGALLGLIPGCGVQIIVMSFYLKGSFPFAALVANTISQDGDALFPLIAMNKKAAFWATVVTTIPAIIVGSIVYFI